MEDTEGGTSSLGCSPEGFNSADQSANDIPVAWPASNEKEDKNVVAGSKKEVSSTGAANNEIEWQVVNDDISERPGNGTHQNVPFKFEDAQATLFALQETSKTITEAFNRDYSSILKNIYYVVRHAADACMQAAASIDFEGIEQALIGFATRLNYLAILKKTDWPLYLVMNDQMVKSIGSLSADADVEVLRSQVCDIALDALDSAWIDEVHARWDEHDELSEGERMLLGRALDLHRCGQYEACVSILMCLVGGLLHRYCDQPNRLSDNQKSEFDSRAKKHNLEPIASRHRTLNNAKDLVLVPLVRNENGYYFWEAAVSYIVDIVLTNSNDFEKMSVHNPLRNKICHGRQTNYGTKEISIKAILATDIIIRLVNAREIMMEDEA